MDHIINEIKRALLAGHFYVALLSTLTMPDICAALESPNGVNEKALYLAWRRKWFTSYTFLTAEDIYYLRCGVVHQGRLGHTRSNYKRVVFTLPNSHLNVYHNNVMGDALNLDLVIFCTDMASAVERWYATQQHDPNVQRNLMGLLQYHEHGLAPYFGGNVPIIA
jgi:hypothetical protein